MSAVLPSGRVPASFPVRQSRLKNIARSPAHYLAALERDREDTLAMRLGRFTHAIILGWPKVLVFEGDRRGKAWKAFYADNFGNEIATAKEWETASAMAASVQRDEDAMRRLTGTAEREIEWTLAGRVCQARLDVISDEQTDGPDWISELKSTRDGRPNRFPWDCQKLGYLAQGAFYLDGVNAPDMSGFERTRPIEELFIVAVESTFPYLPTVYRVPPKLIDIGRRTYRMWFERLLVCEATGEWPGYVDGETELDLPDDGDLPLLIEEEEAA